MMNHPSKEGGLFVSTPIQNIFDICNFFFTTLFGFLIFFCYICICEKIDGKTVLQLKPIKR